MLTWNLFHGRSLPPAARALEGEFTSMLAGWEWDLALLQEVPPWWPARLARAAAAEQRSALTSRNAGLALRRALAERWPELIKSNGGGANAVLARVPIRAERAVTLRRWPERRVAQLLRLYDGTVAANLHGSARVPLAEEELARLWDLALAWAGEEPVVLGGDLNLRRPAGAEGAAHVASRDVDHIFAWRMEAQGPAERLPRGITLDGRALELSDHVPLAVTLERLW